MTHAPRVHFSAHPEAENADLGDAILTRSGHAPERGIFKGVDPSYRANAIPAIHVNFRPVALALGLDCRVAYLSATSVVQGKISVLQENTIPADRTVDPDWTLSSIVTLVIRPNVILATHHCGPQGLLMGTAPLFAISGLTERASIVTPTTRVVPHCVVCATLEELNSVVLDPVSPQKLAQVRNEEQAEER